MAKAKVDSGIRTIDGVIKAFRSADKPLVPLRTRCGKMRYDGRMLTMAGYYHDVPAEFIIGFAGTRFVIQSTRTWHWHRKFHFARVAPSPKGAPKMYVFGGGYDVPVIDVDGMTPDRKYRLTAMTDRLYKTMENDMAMNGSKRHEVVALWCQVLYDVGLSDYIHAPPETGR